MISIILPTFNREKILTTTIDCILNQTFEDYELIIINDASNDNTESIIKKYQTKNNKIKYIHNQQNMGCAISRQLGYENSKGSIIVFIDDDDIWPNDKLIKQYSLIKNYDMIISDYNINHNDKLIYKSMKPFSMDFKNEILKRPGPFFQSIMIRKSIMQKIKLPFDPKSVPSEDWNFFIELSKLNPKIAHIAEPLFTWNINNNNQSLDLKKEALALEYILKKHHTYFQKHINKNIFSGHYRRIARLYEKLYIENGNTKNIIKFYQKAFNTHPLSIKNIFYRMNTIIGYRYTRFIIDTLRKIRGVPNA